MSEDITLLKSEAVGPATASGVGCGIVAGSQSRDGEAVENAVSDLEFFRQTHVDWAEHFEANPELAAQYVAAGEWDDADEHRRIVLRYDNALAAISSLREQLAAAEIERDLLTETARWLTEHRDELVERWHALADLNFHRAEAVGSKLHLELSGEIVRALASAIAVQFGAQGAENYIEMQLTDRATREMYTVTFQRQRGKTPHQLRDQAEHERDGARQQLAAAREAVDLALHRLREPCTLNDARGGRQILIEYTNAYKIAEVRARRASAEPSAASQNDAAQSPNKA